MGQLFCYKTIILSIQLNCDRGVQILSDTVSTYAGSTIMWSKNVVTFTYSGGSISKSSAIQNSGAIFPLNMSQKGIRKTQSSSSMQTYVGTYTGSGGIPTPWGNANLISQTRSLRTIIHGNGSYSGGWIN